MPKRFKNISDNLKIDTSCIFNDYSRARSGFSLILWISTDYYYSIRAHIKSDGIGKFPSILELAARTFFSESVVKLKDIKQNLESIILEINKYQKNHPIHQYTKILIILPRILTPIYITLISWWRCRIKEADDHTKKTVIKRLALLAPSLSELLSGWWEVCDWRSPWWKKKSWQSWKKPKNQCVPETSLKRLGRMQKSLRIMAWNRYWWWQPRLLKKAVTIDFHLLAANHLSIN